ncbi:MAG: hypothetical protein HQL55_10650, partial [Magnetococcales bacterium]|nr:hypothetical protein [Magnetococcales bacterium]
EYEQVLDARDFLNQRLQVNAGWIPNPAWKKGMTASYWQDERPLQRKRIGTSYGMARMK